MKKQTGYYPILAFTVLLVTSAILFGNCSKKLSNDRQVTAAPQELLNETKKQFDNLVSNAKEENRMTKSVDKLAWDNALEYKKDDVNFIMVPFNEGIKPFANQNYEFARALIFNKVDGVFAIQLVELLGDKGKSLGKFPLDAVAMSFRNIHMNKDDRIDGMNASVMLFDDSYVQQKSFHISNGKWEVSRIVFRSDLPITQ